MNHKVNFYGFETGVLLDITDKEFNSYACYKELNYGFYNEDDGFFLEKEYKKNLKYIRDYVENGVDGTYGIISNQGEVDIGGEEYNKILKGEYSVENMNYDFFKDLSSIEYSICKKNGKIVEYFLEDAIKTCFAKKIQKDIELNDLNITPRAKYTLKSKGILTLKQLLETPLSDMKNFRGLSDRNSFYSIRKEFNRVCCERYLIDSFNLNISINFDGKTLFVAEESSSGCKYKVSNKQEMIKKVCNYIADYLDEDNQFEIHVERKG